MLVYTLDGIQVARVTNARTSADRGEPKSRSLNCFSYRLERSSGCEDNALPHR